MEIKDLKAEAYDTAVMIEVLQRKLMQLNGQIAKIEAESIKEVK